MADLFEYYIAGDGTAYYFFGSRWGAQTFTPSTAHTITSVKIKLYRDGLPGTITVSIRATDGSGHPTGEDLCSGTTNGDTLTTDFAGEWREITLGAGYNLSPDVKYAIVVRAPSGNLGAWRFDISSSTYTGGCYESSDDSGESWTPVVTSDFMFEEWGDLLVIPTVTTQAVTSITTIAATGNGTIAATGGVNCDKRGICWNTTGNPTIADSKAEETDSFGTGAFTRSMTGLSLGIKYYVKAYAHNLAGYGYGNEVDFTTLGYEPSGTIGDVIDCSALVSTYDRLEWTEDLPTSNQTITVQVRSSPDNSDWTEWETVYASPCTSFTTTVQRYLEWRAVLATSEGNITPTLSDFGFYWTNQAE